jgi:hypothetical protein
LLRARASADVLLARHVTDHVQLAEADELPLDPFPVDRGEGVRFGRDLTLHPLDVIAPVFRDPKRP